MFKQIVKNSLLFAMVIALMIVEPSINAWLNFWLQDLFNSADIGTPFLLIIRILTIGFLIWILKRIVVYVSGVIQSFTVCKVKKDVKRNAFRRLFKLDYNKLFENDDSGRFLSFFTNDINILEQKYLDGIFGLISGIFALVILGASFLTLNRRLGIFIVGFGLISSLVPVAFSKLLNAKNKKYSDDMSRFTLRLKEYLAAYPTIKNYAIEKQIGEQFEQTNDEVESSKFDYESNLTLSNNVGSMLSWFMQFMAVGLGLILVSQGKILIGTVVAARSFSSDLAMPLQSIITNLNSITSVKSVVNRMETLALSQNADEEVQIIDTSNGVTVEYADLSVKFDNKEVVSHINFTFEPQKKYLIVGRNGCGKSTLFKTLKKRTDGYSGDILINGQSINNISNVALSKCVSYLNENVSIFSGNLQDNILLFRCVEREKLARAVKDAQINLELDRKVLDGGANLSSGEQRRIEIARTLIDSVGFIVFDEVISTLDIETAYEIEKMILEYSDKTVVFISHNFSGLLMDRYDEIIYMDDGKIVAHGPLEKMKTNEDFMRLLHIKFGDNFV